MQEFWIKGLSVIPSEKDILKDIDFTYISCKEIEMLLLFLIAVKASMHF